MDFVSALGDIGGVAGYPAMLLVFWLYTKVKSLEKRLDDGEGRFRGIEDEIKETNKLLYMIIGKMNLILEKKDIVLGG